MSKYVIDVELDDTEVTTPGPFMGFLAQILRENHGPAVVDAQAHAIELPREEFSNGVEIEQRLEAARSVFFNARDLYCTAAYDAVVESARKWADDTVTLYVEGEWSEDGFTICRARGLADSQGNVVMFDDPDVDLGTEVYNRWERLTDHIDPYLDLLIELQHDDWIGKHEIDLVR